MEDLAEEPDTQSLREFLSAEVKQMIFNPGCFFMRVLFPRYDRVNFLERPAVDIKFAVEFDPWEVFMDRVLDVIEKEKRVFFRRQEKHPAVIMVNSAPLAVKFRLYVNAWKLVRKAPLGESLFFQRITELYSSPSACHV